MKVWIPFVIICFLLAYWLIRLWQRPTESFWQRLTLFAAWIYTAFICRICFAPATFQFTPTHNIHYFLIDNRIILNLIPFQDMDIAFWLNVVMTVPAGIFYALIIRPKHWYSILGLSIGTGLFLETTQFIIDWTVNLGRWVEVDDLITNAAGVLIGLLIVYLLDHTFFSPLVKKFKITF